MGEEVQFSCPYCGEINYTEVFFSEGSHQTFINDCEVCCRPIEISVRKDKDGHVLVDVRNDEGF